MSKHCPIDVVVPWGMKNNLGAAYNEYASRASDWFLFVDNDVYLATNPWWYEIAVNAINKVGSGAGWITCYTNRIHNNLQTAPGVDKNSNDIEYHRKFALDMYNRNQGKILDTTVFPGRFSGFFILSRKAVWKSVGGFREDTGGLLHIDIDYYDKVKRAGFHQYIMTDLYVYHGYFRDSVKGSTFARPEL